MAILGGWAADRLIAKGYNPVTVRKTFVIVGFVLGSLLCVSLIMIGSQFFGPRHVEPQVPGVVATSAAAQFGTVGLLVAILGMFFAFAGAAIAHLMFELPVFFASRHQRAGAAQLLGEFVATFGLLAVIAGCARRPSALTAVAVAGLTVYDMCKSMDKSMTLSDIRLLEKTGGKSGTWRRK